MSEAAKLNFVSVLACALAAMLACAQPARAAGRGPEARGCGSPRASQASSGARLAGLIEAHELAMLEFGVDALMPLHFGAIRARTRPEPETPAPARVSKPTRG